MFLKCSTRIKDGKERRTWSIVESRRLANGRSVHRHVLYLGEINDDQRSAWQKSIEVFDDGAGSGTQQMAIFPEDRKPESSNRPIISVKLDQMELRRPRQWGACWVALELWRLLGLDVFWREKLPPSRKGTPWDVVLTILVIGLPPEKWTGSTQWNLVSLVKVFG